MLKKIMVALMGLFTAYRFGALAFVLSTNMARFPAFIYLSTGLVVALGVWFVCKSIVRPLSDRDLMSYFTAMSGSVVLNLAYIKMFSRMEIVVTDMLLIGSLMDIVVAVTVMYMMYKERRYIRLALSAAK